MRIINFRYLIVIASIVLFVGFDVTALAHNHIKALIGVP